LTPPVLGNSRTRPVTALGPLRARRSLTLAQLVTALRPFGPRRSLALGHSGARPLTALGRSGALALWRFALVGLCSAPPMTSGARRSLALGQVLRSASHCTRSVPVFGTFRRSPLSAFRHSALLVLNQSGRSVSPFNLALRRCGAWLLWRVAALGRSDSWPVTSLDLSGAGPLRYSATLALGQSLHSGPCELDAL
jgi:hypothetical protein